jgi:hypothetical protein
MNLKRERREYQNLIEFYDYYYYYDDDEDHDAY